jgi:Glycosyltransferase family 87
MSSIQIQPASPRQRLGLTLLWATAWLTAGLSVLAGVRKATLSSQDFQWSPTRLLLHHIDPFKDALAGNQGHAIILSQGPNYAHFFYLMLAPLGSMSFPAARVVWAVCNLVFAAITLISVRRIFHQASTQWGITSIVFLCGTPFRVALGNGQQSLITLFFVALAFALDDRWSKALCVGLSYCKYSFAPPYFFDVLFSRPYGLIAVTLIPAAIGLIWAHWMLGGSWLHLTLEPIMVGATQNRPGISDWMAIVDSYFGGLGKRSALFFLLKYIAPILASAAIAWHIRRRFDPGSGAFVQAATAIYGITALVMFRHLSYDFVFLVFAFAFGVKYKDQVAARWLLVGIIYIWFGQKLEDLLLTNHFSELLPLNFLILCTMLIASMRIRPGSSASSGIAGETP